MERLVEGQPASDRGARMQTQESESRVCGQNWSELQDPRPLRRKDRACPNQNEDPLRVTLLPLAGGIPSAACREGLGTPSSSSGVGGGKVLSSEDSVCVSV